MSLGDNFSAAVDSDGNLWVWGGNAYGQLGTGDTENVLTPFNVYENVSFTTIDEAIKGVKNLSSTRVKALYVAEIEKYEQRNSIHLIPIA